MGECRSTRDLRSRNAPARNKNELMKTTNRIIKSLCGAVLSLIHAFGLLALSSSTAIAQTIADPAIAFISSSPSGAALSVMNANGSNIKPLFSSKSGRPGWPNWSPDGQWITFSLDSRSINVISKNGGTPALLVNVASGLVGNPVWSPLGDRIAYSWLQDSSATTSEVRAIPVNGGPAQVLHHFQSPLSILGGLSWSPDATLLTVAIYDESLPNPNRCSNLSILDTVTGAVLDVTRPLGFDWVANSAADWARHSNRIAFRGAKVGEAPALWILDLDLMQASKLVDSSGPTSLSWSPDDAKIVFDKNGELWTINVATGAQALLAKVNKGNTRLSWPNWRRF